MTNNDFRPALWIALVVLAVANGATSAAGLTVVSVALGVLTLGVAVALVVQYRRHRRTTA
ncbi:hypothetical protein Aab01nite_34640 [Paractinoplanes abujensis]|uniref:Uncharacterized protein n=1 Tax=Paractinoplanes abujensis TaxID=882441 RepID=A0A7W7CZP0_9ACTN|nr:hypothetical protein [Actinoplanes abujensis]MBB4697637.1 hypothetical protein [Actinoplanes abujensis]GID19874.1 hypothetical protein Aab01nite_34640 [Actinoplanes abujensis]